jgi:hypothetical protein
MKSVIFAAAIASAAAFAPAPVAKTSSALNAFENELGAQPPLGFFDPLGMLEGADQAEFDRLREVEIKHGRISMLAVVGYLTTASGYRFDGYPADVPAGLGAWKALCATSDGQNVLGQMAIFFAIAELANRDVPWSKTTSEFPGDYRNGALDFGWDRLSDADKLRKRSIELNNGRAAQMGILGLMVHEAMGVSILPGGVLP